MNLQGKVALVTGSAHRVGRTIALSLAQRGCHLIVHYRHSRAEALETVRRAESLGVRVLCLKADLQKASSIHALFKEIRRSFKRLDILVNNAAVFFKTPFRRLTEEDWDNTLDANLKGPFLCALEAGKIMVRQGGGKIVNIADWCGIKPYQDYLPYCVSKAGVIALTKALAVELAPKVQVNCVAPGPILMPKDFSKKEARQVKGLTLLKRIGKPEDVAQAVLFFLESTDFATGTTLFIEGGELLAAAGAPYV